MGKTAVLLGRLGTQVGRRRDNEVSKSAYQQHFRILNLLKTLWGIRSVRKHGKRGRKGIHHIGSIMIMIVTGNNKRNSITHL